MRCKSDEALDASVPAAIASSPDRDVPVNRAIRDFQTTKIGRMYRPRGLTSLSVALGTLAVAVVPAQRAAAAQQPLARTCAGAVTTTTGPTGATGATHTIAPGSEPPAGGCWEDVQPYPFGSDGSAVTAPSDPNPSNPSCIGGISGEQTCYLAVTSMAFRAWNRGLAATTDPTPGNPFGLWLFNGARWFPDPTFPGSKTCPGNKVLWAGKLDYWLIGAEGRLCRFDGASVEWQPLELPAATRERLTEVVSREEGGHEVLANVPKGGGITSGACFAWNNCWFFGVAGAVVQWNGKKLTDASPDPSLSLLQGEYTAAVAREGPAGESFGVAAGATSEALSPNAVTKEEREPLSTQPGEPPAQLYDSSGAAFTPLAFTPFTVASPDDPYRTDLVGVDVDAAGQGWVAGNPAGLRVSEVTGESNDSGAPSQPVKRAASPHGQPQDSPLQPISLSGAASACQGPPADRFTYTSVGIADPGAFLWSSIAVVPGTGEGLAGGKLWPAQSATGPFAVGEPVITQAGCDGTTTTTRFPLAAGASAPADIRGSVTAIVANATNDAWAATSKGEELLGSNVQPPHLYRLTNGAPPAAAEGNDDEERPPEVVLDKPIIVIEPPGPEPPALPAPAPVTQTHSVTLPAAIYDVKAKLHTGRSHGHLYLRLYITFKLRRATTIGAQALRHGRVVSVARPRNFAGHTGTLILSLNRKHWPTKVKFVA